MHPGAGRDDRIDVERSGTYVLAGRGRVGAERWRVRALDLVRIARPLPEVLGSSRVEPRDSAIQQTVQQVTAIVRLEAGEKVSLLAGQGSGGDLEMQRASLSAAFAGREAELTRDVPPWARLARSSPAPRWRSAARTRTCHLEQAGAEEHAQRRLVGVHHSRIAGPLASGSPSSAGVARALAPARGLS